MIAWYDALDGLNTFYFLSAVAGGLFFVVRLLISFVAGEFSSHVGEPGGHSAAGDPGDTDVSFQFLTIQGLTAFFLFSGLAGLAVRLQFAGSIAGSVLAAALTGLAAMALNAFLVRALLGLQSSGTLNLNNAIGKEATVYLTIRAHGSGQIRMEIQQRLQIFEAISSCDRDIPTDARVRVIGVEGALMRVEPLNS